jgi:hypothetical protein
MITRLFDTATNRRQHGARAWRARRCLLACTCILLALPGAAQAEEAQWTLAQETDGIRLYTRTHDTSPFWEIKAAMTINARAEAVAEAFGDGNGCSAWRAMCKASTVVEHVSDNERYVHMVLNMPWPVADRDLVMRVTDSIDIQSQQAVVQFTSASEKQPPDDWVRAQANGQYLINMINDEQVAFTYIIHTDLGGDLSASMINPRLADATIEDLQRLRKQAQGR